MSCRLPRALGLAAGALALGASARAQNRLYTFDGAGEFDVFGWSVCALGDVDGDGRQDFAVGAYEPFPADTSPGYVRVYSGATGGVLQRFSVGQPGAGFGYAVGGEVDLDADGRGDLIVGAPFFDQNGGDSGRVYVRSCTTGALLWRGDGEGSGDLFGHAVSVAGDVDGDGTADFAVGARGDDDGAPDAGSARVYSGATGLELARVDGGAAGDELGYSVGAAGDVDGDGRDDWIVGARQLDVGPGYALVVSGTDGSTIFTVSGDTFGDRFGSSVCGGSDLNGDGLAEVIVGAPKDDPNGIGLFPGSLRVFAAPSGTELYLVAGVLDDALGTGVDFVGDVDGDGTDDFATGARHDSDPLANHVGRAEVWSGATGQQLFHVFGDGDDNFFGAAVAGIGDVDGEGTPDLLVGAFREDSTGEAAGRAVVISGGCLPPASFCTALPNGAGTSATIGWSGSYVHADNALTLTVDGARPGQFGVFFYARSTTAEPFGNGILCLEDDPVGVFRLNPPVLADGSGHAQRALDLTAPPASAGAGLVEPGTEWHFQFWYRDPMGPLGAGFNVSDGLSVAFCP